MEGCYAYGLDRNMTKNPDYRPRPTGDRSVVFIAFPEMCALDLAGPQTVFWNASKLLRECGLGGYRCHTVSMTGGLVYPAEGVALATQSVADIAAMPVDTVMVPGSFSLDQLVHQSNELVVWLRQIAKRARRMTSVCSGAFLLAQADLLTGKRAATHWLMCDDFQSRFPDITVDRDAIFVKDGRVWTSAGVTACIDLALALVEADFGRDVAMRVARELVVFLKRPGGQSQFSQFLEMQAQDEGVFDEFHAWLGDNIAREDLTVEILAEQASMSLRHFARLYKQKTGRTPAKALELFRLESARRMLEDSDRSVAQIAIMCGFGDEERLRLTFHRNLSLTPREYRHRFSAKSQAS